MKKMSVVCLALLVSLAGCHIAGEPVSAPVSQSPTANMPKNTSPHTESTDTDPALFKEFSRIADLDRDGEQETVRVLTHDNGDGFILQVCDSNGETLWQDAASNSHAGWLSYSLCQTNDADYLLKYSPYMGQGVCELSYRLFSLDASGKEVVAASNNVEFDINFDRPSHSFDVEKAAALMNEVNAYLGDSSLLLNTNPDLCFGYGQPLQDNLTWLDDYHAVPHDKDADIAEFLAAYRDYHEMAQQ